MGKPQKPCANAVNADVAAHRLTTPDAYACRLIARIQRDQFDTEAVLALASHYEKNGDLPSLANLMEGWAQTLPQPGTAAGAYIAAADAALAAGGDQARARRLYQRALERSPQHALARARLQALDSAARSTPPPPPPPRRRASAHAGGSTPSQAISEIRTVEGGDVWLDDEHLELLEEPVARGSCAAQPSATFARRARRYEETQRIWRRQIT